GYKPEELIGRPVSGLVHPEDIDHLNTVMRRVIRAGEPSTRIEYRYRKADGEYLWVETLGTILYRPEGGFAGIICASRDIGERKKIEVEQKQLEENLKREKERFQVLVDASPLGVSLVGPDGRYKYLNPKFTAIFGYTLEDVPAGRDWFRKAYPDETYRREVIVQWMKDLQEFPSGESRPRTFKVICKDGAEKVIHFSPVSMETGDQLVIYEDITERKKLEVQLIQAQKMEAVGTLAGGIAHDFNNLLMAIQGNVSLMLMDLPAHHPDRERLQQIEGCVRSGADLTKQLLGFARRGKYQVKPTDLNDLIAKASALFGRTQKGIRIHQKFARGAWAVEVDRGQMEQVLLNLLVNAWQAMPQGGDLYLETQNVFLDAHYVQPFEVKLGNYVKTSVTDTGIGMDEETKQRIFEPFFTTKERGRGTGLGLATVYGIIKGHEGFITVYSEPDRGTTFNFYIPASARAAEEEKKEHAVLKTGQGGILLVDDEEAILQVAAQLLEKLGYTVFKAHNGREALDLYSQKAGEIDLVILDLIMPVMGGGEAFQNLKKLNPGVKVLLSSGYSINGLAKEILDQGCRGFIQKPFDLKEISVKIREILDSEDAG
ncbi:MAG: PAS domain-containing sensor histidine kinase, partial [Desulfobacteraceae bacterium]